MYTTGHWCYLGVMHNSILGIEIYTEYLIFHYFLPYIGIYDTIIRY